MGRGSIFLYLVITRAHKLPTITMPLLPCLFRNLIQLVASSPIQNNGSNLLYISPQPKKVVVDALSVFPKTY